jgi:hypothetical protein
MELDLVGSIGAVFVVAAGGVMAVGAWLFERSMHRQDEADGS